MTTLDLSETGPRGITLEELAHLFSAELRLAEPGRIGRPLVRGVHVSELDDPTPYLEGGELLLTTGIPLVGSADPRPYVDRLVGRGVVALGLGLGAGTDAVDPGLAEACRAAGLPLFVVPPGVPFQRISRGYWEVVSRLELADLSSRLRVQTALAQAAADDDPGLLLDRLARGVGGWAAYVSFDGEVALVRPATATAELAGIVAGLGRLRSLGPHTGATFPQDGDVVIGHAVMDGRRSAGFLAVGAADDEPRPDRHVLLTAAALLGVCEGARERRRDADDRVGAVVTGLVLAGRTDAARAVTRQEGLGAPADEVRLCVVRAPAAALASRSALAATVAGLEGEGVQPLAAALASTPWWLRLRGSAVALVAADVPLATTHTPTPPHADASRADLGRPGSPHSHDAPAVSPGADLGRLGSPRSGDAPADSRRADLGRLGSPRSDDAPADSPRASEARGGFPPAESPRAERTRAGSFRVGSPRDVAPHRDLAGSAVLGSPQALEQVPLALERMLRLAGAVPTGRLAWEEDPSGTTRAARWREQLVDDPAGEALPTVVSYLRHRGHWEPAARELGVHRNSVRNRIAAVSERLDLDLDDADVAAELWLALREAGLAGRQTAP
jgi:purine catabolism regulator